MNGWEICSRKGGAAPMATAWEEKALFVSVGLLVCSNIVSSVDVIHGMTLHLKEKHLLGAYACVR